MFAYREFDPSACCTSFSRSTQRRPHSPSPADWSLGACSKAAGPWEAACGRMVIFQSLAAK